MTNPSAAFAHLDEASLRGLAPHGVVRSVQKNTIVVYEGEGLGGSNRVTAAGTGTAVWTPVATPYDRAANPMSTAAATESGAADREF